MRACVRACVRKLARSSSKVDVGEREKEKFASGKPGWLAGWLPACLPSSPSARLPACPPARLPPCLLPACQPACVCMSARERLFLSFSFFLSSFLPGSPELPGRPRTAEAKNKLSFLSVVAAGAALAVAVAARVCLGERGGDSLSCQGASCLPASCLPGFFVWLLPFKLPPLPHSLLWFSDAPEGQKGHLPGFI